MIFEYELCHSGYIARDCLVPREFSYFLQTFVIFTTLVAAARAFTALDEGLAAVIFLLLGASGFVAMLAFLVDIQANTSCKRALAARARLIEKSPDFGPRYWSTLEKRPMFREEYLVKKPIAARQERSGAGYFVIAARALLGLWCGLVLIVFFWGEALQIRP